MQVGYEDKPRRKATRAERGHVAADLESKRKTARTAAGVALPPKANCEPQRYIREFRLDKADENLYLSSRNLPNVLVLEARHADPVSLVRRANALAGTHGYGRLDMIENRVVGIKSREIYETPGLLLLIKAHQELETLTLAPDVQRYKRSEEHTSELSHRT